MPVNPKIYNIVWSKLVSWLLETDLFKPKMFAWCKSLVSPLVTLHGEFLIFRKQRIYDLSITPQVCRLQKLLNDRFDFTDRRIYIDDGKKGDKTYIFKDSEDEPLYFFRESEFSVAWIYTDGEVGDTPAHFIVYIPVAVSVDLNIMKTLLNIYKLPSRRYQIQSI